MYFMNKNLLIFRYRIMVFDVLGVKKNNEENLDTGV